MVDDEEPGVMVVVDQEHPDYISDWQETFLISWNNKYSNYIKREHYKN